MIYIYCNWRVMMLFFSPLILATAVWRLKKKKNVQGPRMEWLRENNKGLEAGDTDGDTLCGMYPPLPNPQPAPAKHIYILPSIVLVNIWTFTMEVVASAKPYHPLNYSFPKKSP